MSHGPSPLATASAPRTPFNADDFFGRQSTGTGQLPDPEPLLVNLSRCVIEIFAGVRDLEQLMRWVSEDLYTRLLRRQLLAERARTVKGVRARRPQLSVLSVRQCHPRDGIVEGVVVVHMPNRVRAVAIRLEGLDRRWRATALSVL